MIKRHIYERISAHLSKKEITLLAGARQVGKTTIMSWLNEDLKSKQIPTLFLNLDFESDAIHLESQKDLLSIIRLNFGNEYGVVFIDEIQRKENAGLFLKGIYDKDHNVKFVISGSGSLELKEKIAESLAGRKRLFEITPVSFLEFVDYKTDYTFSDRLVDYIKTDISSSNRLLQEYSRFGGYPAVIIAENEEDKRQTLLEIINSYISRDVRQILSVNHVSAYNKLLNVLAQQVSLPAKYSTLSQFVNITANTVKDYLWYMEQTYILRESKPYYTNALKEIVKEPVRYFVDLGFLNLLRNNLFSDYETPAYGFVFQNFILNELYNLFINEFVSLKYWRTKDKAEVDIIIDYPGNPIPVEVKYTDFKRPKISRSLQSYLNRYRPAIAFIITKSGKHDIQREDTKIVFLPYYELYTIRDMIIHSGTIHKA